MNSWMCWLIGGVVVLVAIVALLVVFKLATSRGADANGAMAAVTGTMGTIIGAYFGVAAGVAGTEEARRRAEHEEERAQALQGRIDDLTNQLLDQQSETGRRTERTRAAEGISTPEQEANVGTGIRSERELRQSVSRGCRQGAQGRIMWEALFITTGACLPAKQAMIVREGTGRPIRRGNDIEFR